MRSTITPAAVAVLLSACATNTTLFTVGGNGTPVEIAGKSWEVLVDSDGAAATAILLRDFSNVDTLVVLRDGREAIETVTGCRADDAHLLLPQPHVRAGVVC